MFSTQILRVSLPSSERLHGSDTERLTAYLHTKKALSGIKFYSIVVTKGVLNYLWEIDIEFRDIFPETFATTEAAKASTALISKGFSKR